MMTHVQNANIHNIAQTNYNTNYIENQQPYQSQNIYQHPPQIQYQSLKTGQGNLYAPQ